MRTIIAGSREFDDYDFLCDSLQEIPWEITEVISGTARGADILGEKYAVDSTLPLRLFPADWSRHGKAAGHIRNSEMASYAKALIAFWNGKSKGTKNMIETAAKKGLFVKVFRYEQN